MNTEQIISVKPVNAAGRKLALVLTASGQEIWVNESQIDDKAETISYNSHKAGSKWVNTKLGTEGVRKGDTNEFVGCGKTNKLAILDYLIAKGITPTFTLG